ncbi:hypothetical protein [Lonepinella sp. BR2357]|uniref:hypothetical protein n=1 Tax=Lonepinella sp. BR2357 TaxID=3434549 RepID=UPI003F6DCE6A
MIQQEKIITPPANAELIHTLIQYGDVVGENIKIQGNTREEKLAHFKEVYYAKNHRHGSTK